MARRNSQNTSARIARWIKEGRGFGQGANYQPWLRTQDVSSRGFVSRVPGWKTAREHHLMSNLERDVFYTLEWASHVIDTREQFPLLPLEVTMGIAEKLGFEHPKEPGTREPIVMTTDFLITTAGTCGNVDMAICVKPASELEKVRIQQKLAIEEAYWKTRSTEWIVVTERNIPHGLAFNVRWVHNYLDIAGKSNVTDRVKDHVAELVADLLAEGMRLAEAASTADDRLGLPVATSLSLIRHFIATRRWAVDMEQQIDPQQPLILLNQSVEKRTHGALRQQSA